MMDRYGTESQYNKQLVNAFKKGDEPEIIIVVDKLLTGFDAPCNTVLYLARKLKGHTLLQAIARVNRLYEGKEHGLILDYSGVIEDLDEAIDFYHELADFDPDDVAETVHMIEDQAAELPQYHSDLWELFPGMRGSVDTEVFAEHLRPKDLRDKFYDRFGLFARTLALALSSTNFLEDTPEDTIQQYKRDLKFFANLRADVSYRFQERIDYSEYEPQIRKLIDQHVTAGEIVTLCDPVNLFDAAERQKVLESEGKSTEAKADTIASATKRIIEVEMNKDPAFYRKFSKMLQDVLDDLYEKRIEALEALEKITEIHEQVLNHSESGVPDELQGQDMARRYHGILREDDNPLSPDAIRIALEIQSACLNTKSATGEATTTPARKWRGR